MSDPRAKLGVPVPRDPIAGTKHVPKRTRLRKLGDEYGWTFKYHGGDYEFTKGDTVLNVAFYGDSPAEGILFRDLTVRERGLSVTSEGVWGVLRGEKCICPSFTDELWEQGYDEIHHPSCPVKHPPRRYPPENDIAQSVRGIDVERVEAEQRG